LTINQDADERRVTLEEDLRRARKQLQEQEALKEHIAGQLKVRIRPGRGALVSTASARTPCCPSQHPSPRHLM